MSAAQFTPGPWAFTVESDGGKFELTAGDGTTTVLTGCGCCGSPVLCGEDHMADARLMAAAPELLAALQMLTRGYGVTFQDQALRSFAQDAIVKATGSTT